MRNLNEEENTIQRLIVDDAMTMRDVYRKHKNGCLLSLQKLGASLSDAEDLYQEAFVAFIINVKKGSFRGESKLSTYINTIAKYKFFNLSKKPKVRTDDISEMNIAEEEKSELMYSSELIDELGIKLEALDDKCRSLLRSYYFKGLGLKSISTEMGLSYDFIRQKKKRCINKLKGSITNA